MANLIVLSDLPQLQIDMVLYRGDIVARDGKPIFILPQVSGGLTNTINFKTFNIEALMLSASAETMAVIEVVPAR